MDSLISQFNLSEISDSSKEGDVEILVYENDDIIRVYYTYKYLLTKSPVIKDWFERLEFYGDYLPISDSMCLYNTNNEYSYSLIILGENNLFENYDTRVIKDLISYLNNNNNRYYSRELIGILKILQLI
jgi:hypothetical protein